MAHAGYLKTHLSRIHAAVEKSREKTRKDNVTKTFHHGQGFITEKTKDQGYARRDNHEGHAEQEEKQKKWPPSLRKRP